MKKLLLLLQALIVTLLFSQESFFLEEESSEEEVSSLSNLDFGGSIETGSLYMDDTFYYIGEGELEGEFSGNYFDVVTSINIELSPIDSFSDFPLQDNKGAGDIYINTLYLRYYHDYFDIELGLIKPVWGSGDGIHFVDYLTPLDLREPFDPEYLERKISQEMLKINIPIGESSLIEGVYKPRFQGDSIAMDGVWTPYYIKSMDEKLFSIMYPIALSQNPGVPEEVVRSQAKELANTLDIESGDYFTDSEASIRYTTTLSTFDLGLTYYWGHLKTPTMDHEKAITNGEIELYYNRVHSFGFDLGGQLGLFNLKGEASYNLTEDFEGDDPSILNNSFGYLVGFDINLPVNNLNLLLQGVGNITINSDDIGTIDPEYSDDYNEFMILGRVSDNYFYETLFLEIAGSYDFIDQDYLISPIVTYDLNDNLSFEVKYTLLEGDDSTDFGQFDDNDSLKVTVEIIL